MFDRLSEVKEDARLSSEVGSSDSRGEKEAKGVIPFHRSLPRSSFSEMNQMMTNFKFYPHLSLLMMITKKSNI